MITGISVDPHIHFGKPIVTGTRITVENVLELVKQGISFHQIQEDFYPDLRTVDIQACIQFATVA